MERWKVIILLCLVSNMLYGQFQDNFGDGEILNDPEWSGDVFDFIVNEDFELQLMAAEAGSSTIFLSGNYPDSVEWKIYFKMDFAPSGSNQLRIYLLSTASDIENTQGYYLEVGESGAEDALKFFRQDGENSELLGVGSMSALASAPAQASLKILRHGDGFWEIGADYAGGSAFQTEIEIFDDSYDSNQEAYFILHCDYSDSRKDKFFFDDISMQEIVPDTSAPELLEAIVIDSDHIRVLYNEAMDKESVELAGNYQFSPTLSVNQLTYDEGLPFGVDILLTEDLQSGTVYELRVQNVSDIVGNTLSSETVSLKLLESPDVGDLVINEILFDPFQDAEDFVEIHNRSSKFIRLDGVSIANLDKGEEEEIITGLEIDPEGYLVFSPIIEALEEHYIILDSEALIEQALPSFNNESGNVSLTYQTPEEILFIDAVDYLETQHFVLIDETEGVSLERIDPNGESANMENWHSAASAAGFATPGYKNSQFLDAGSTLAQSFELSKKVFSPDGDGTDELLIIQYELDQPGFLANVKIFNAHGRMMKNLAKNSLLASNGFLKWDGTTDEGRIGPIGIYIVWIEIFHPNGTTEQFTMDCVLAKQLH